MRIKYPKYEMMFIVLILFATFLGSISPNANAQVSPGYQNHSFQYLTGILSSSQQTTSVANAWNADAPPKYYSMSVTTTATGFTVLLEGSLDNINWSQISITNSVIGVVSNLNPIPALYFRMRASAISAGTPVTGTAIGVW